MMNRTDLVWGYVIEIPEVYLKKFVSKKGKRKSYKSVKAANKSATVEAPKINRW
jgi:hypothetical protein